MKRILTLILILLSVAMFSFQASAEDGEWEQVVDSFGLDELEEAAPEDIVSFMKELDLSPDSAESLQKHSLGTILLEYAKEWIDSALLPRQFLRWLLGLCVLAFVFRTLSSSKNGWIGESSNLLIILLCGLWIMAPINDLFLEISETISSAVVYINAFVPIFAGLLTASGYPTLAGSYSTVLIGYSSVFSAIQQSVFVPACRMLLALAVCFPLAGISVAPVEGIRKLLVSLLSVLSGVLTGIVGLQTKLSSVSDNLVTKTAKTAVSTFVPIVGSTLAESLNVVLGSLDLARSSVGIYTVITMTLLFVSPLAKLLCWQIALWMGKACFEAVGEKSIVTMLGSVSSLLTVLIGVLLSSGLLILLTVLMVMSVGRGT